MKAIMFMILIVLTFILCIFSSIASAEQWIIENDGYRYGNSTDITMKPQYDYNPSKRYRGTMDDDGYTRLKNSDGNTIRGNIDEDGYGKLRDNEGNTYRVRPW